MTGVAGLAHVWRTWTRCTLPTTSRIRLVKRARWGKKKSTGPDTKPKRIKICTIYKLVPFVFCRGQLQSNDSFFGRGEEIAGFRGLKWWLRRQRGYKCRRALKRSALGWGRQARVFLLGEKFLKRRGSAESKSTRRIHRRRSFAVSLSLSRRLLVYFTLFDDTYFASSRATTSAPNFTRRLAWFTASTNNIFHLVSRHFSLASTLFFLITLF